MHFFTRIRRALLPAMAIAAVWFAVSGPATAGFREAPPPKATKFRDVSAPSADYTFSYIIVAIGIAMGIALVVRASGRQPHEPLNRYMKPKIISNQP